MASRRPSQTREFAEEASSLWRIAAGPTVWALHLVFCYATAAISCAKTPVPAAAAEPRIVLIAIATVVALVAIGWIGWRAWLQWDLLDDLDYSHPSPEPEDRHEFLGHAAFLLAVLSFIGVLATALPALLIESCL